jgi:hypothetical protein
MLRMDQAGVLPILRFAILACLQAQLIVGTEFSATSVHSIALACSQATDYGGKTPMRELFYMELDEPGKLSS